MMFNILASTKANFDKFSLRLVPGTCFFWGKVRFRIHGTIFCFCCVQTKMKCKTCGAYFWICDWKWHIVQFSFIYSTENSQFGDFMSLGQSIKRVKIYKLSTRNMFIFLKHPLYLNMWFENDTFFNLILFILQKIVNLSISCPRDKA